MRRWRVADAEKLYLAVAESLDHLRPWMPWAADYQPASAAEFLRQCEQDWESGDAFNYAITVPASEVAGSCGLMARIGPGGLEIGYWVHVGHIRRGLATAAAAALVAEAFTLPGIDRVEIVHDEENVASGRIPRKLGFTEIERRPQRPDRPAAADDAFAAADDAIDIVWRLMR